MMDAKPNGINKGYVSKANHKKKPNGRDIENIFLNFKTFPAKLFYREVIMLLSRKKIPLVPLFS